MADDSRLLILPLGSLGPLPALEALSERAYPFLLHSSLAEGRGRWSFFGADPFAVFRGADYAGALAAWRALAAQARISGDAHRSPFTGGAVGYWAYDFGRRLERLPSRARDDLGLPDFVLAFYDVVGAHDHRTKETWLFSSGLPLEGRSRRARAERRLGVFERWLAGAGPPPVRVASSRYAPESRLNLEDARCTHTADGYRRAVESVKEHIRRGDIFQANLSQRWSLGLPGERPGSLGRALLGALAGRSPAPFAALLDAGDHAIASASPERFLELRDRWVETRPIKGTRPRGQSLAEDARLASELLASAKDRAENVMIVDVLRNDLGRVCESGSVETPELCELESFPQVHHLTSTVTGRLRAGLDAFDLLHACFPGGSITGAPKIRAMAMLDELEPVRRHIYTGSLGYLDWRGDADWSIAIRTALVIDGALHFAAGGGITADSDPDAEYAETLHKAEGLRAAIEHAGLGISRMTPVVSARGRR